MRIKHRVEDFRVRELLDEGVLSERGGHRVYRVIKRKLGSLEAAERLARAAGRAAGEVSMAGFKDRQGVTIQHMALERGPSLALREDDLRVEDAGFAAEALRPEHSRGNAFEIVVRGLDAGELARMRANLVSVRAHGVVNYFDDQRFGNLRHGQGWIALRLMRGEHERALRDLLCARSRFENPRSQAFKETLDRCWGDWSACRNVAGRFGAHHSVFEHLGRNPEDFAGAFYHVATRLRLIHLYAFQSHLWNRAVAEGVRRVTPPAERVVVGAREGAQVQTERTAALEQALGVGFRLPGPRLEDVAHPLQHELLRDALAVESLVPHDFVIEGVPGFQLKGEERELVVRPQHLRVRPAERDPLHAPLRLVRLRFELPRGSYATLVVKRLTAGVGGDRGGADDALRPAPRRPDPGGPRARRGDGGKRPPPRGQSPRGGRGSEPRGKRER